MSDRMLIDPERMLPVSEANARGVSKLVSEAAAGFETLVLRGWKPTAFVVGYDRYRHLVESELKRQNTLLALQGVIRKLTALVHEPMALEELLAKYEIDLEGTTE